MHSQLWLKKTRHHPLLMVVVALSVLVAVTGCTKQGDTGEQIIRIASVLPLTGAASSMGQDMRQGQELGAEYFNSHFGQKSRLEMTFEDSKSTPTEGTRAVQSLLAHGHRAFIVELTTVCMAVKPILVENEVLAVLVSSHPAITNPPNPLIFRHSQTAQAEANEIVPAVLALPDIRRVALFYLNDDYGLVFRDTIQDMLGKKLELSEYAFDSNTSDFRSLVQGGALSETKGLAVITVGVGKPLGLLIRTLREQGYGGPVFTTLGYLLTGGREVLGTNRAEIYYTDLTWQDNPMTLWANDQYQERYGKPAPISAIVDFQNVLLIAKALAETGGQDLKAVAHEISRIAPEIVGAPTNSDNDIHPVVLLKKEDI